MFKVFRSTQGLQGTQGNQGNSRTPGSTRCPGNSRCPRSPRCSARVTISENAPSNPQGDLWWDEDNGNLAVYYNDGDSNQWISAINAGAQGVSGIQGSSGGGGGGGVLKELKVFIGVMELVHKVLRIRWQWRWRF